MYSGLAGIVRRTERASTAITRPLPSGAAVLTSRRSWTRRALGQPHGDIEPRLPADDREVGQLTGGESVCDNPHNVFGTPHGLAIDRDDHVPAGAEIRSEILLFALPPAQMGVARRRVAFDARDHRAVLDAVVEMFRERRREVGGDDPDVRVRDGAVLDQLLHRALGRVDRDGEANSLRGARKAA